MGRQQNENVLQRNVRKHRFRGVGGEWGWLWRFHKIFHVWRSPVETVECIWVNIWCVRDWIRDTLLLHAVDQLVSSTKNGTVFVYLTGDQTYARWCDIGLLKLGCGSEGYYLKLSEARANSAKYKPEVLHVTKTKIIIK